MTETELQSLLAAPPLVGTYGPTQPTIRLPAGDIRLTRPLTIRGRYSPQLVGDSIHGTRLLWYGPPDGYAVEFRGCNRPLLSDLTVKFEQPGLGGVLVCNALDTKVTNTAAAITRVCVDAPNWAKVRFGINLDNTAGGTQNNQNGEYHRVLDSVIGGVYCGVNIESTQAHRCMVRGTSFGAGYFGVYAKAGGSQLVEDCSFANVTRCLTLGDQYGGPVVIRRINAEGCRQLARIWAGTGAGVLEDVRCDGMRPFAPTDLRTDGDGYDADYFTAALQVSMRGGLQIRRVVLGSYGQPAPLRLFFSGGAADVTDVQAWRAEGDPAPQAVAKWGGARNWQYNLSCTVMKDGAQPTEEFVLTRG